MARFGPRCQGLMSVIHGVTDGNVLERFPFLTFSNENVANIWSHTWERGAYIKLMFPDGVIIDSGPKR